MNLPLVKLPNGIIVGVLQIVTIAKDDRDGAVSIKTTIERGQDLHDGMIEIAGGPEADAVYEYFSAVGDEIKVTPPVEEPPTAEKPQRVHYFG